MSNSIYTVQIEVEPNEQDGVTPPVPEFERTLSDRLSDMTRNDAELGYQVRRVSVIERM